MNIITQEARKRQAVVKLSQRKGKSYASRMYGVSLSSVKRWCKRYNGDWRSLKEGSHKPKSHPKQHSEGEERLIKQAFREKYQRYGWEGTYEAAVRAGYTRSLSGMIYAAKRMGLGAEAKAKESTAHQSETVPGTADTGRKGTD